MKTLWKSIALSLLVGAPLLKADTAKSNILLICVDDLKPALGCYGDTFAKTPNIDALAQRAAVFERAYCNQAVCSPSRNALMTGLRPPSLGIYDLATNFRKSRPDAVTLAQHFHQAGYKTQALGKIMHVGHSNTEDKASWDVPHFSATAAPKRNPKTKAK
jgi:iduronate 2-sulfatase